MVITRVKYKINGKRGEIKIMRKIRMKYKNNGYIRVKYKNNNEIKEKVTINKNDLLTLSY